MKRVSGKERLLKMAYGGLSPSKAKQMLKDGTANGRPLSSKQKRYFGAVAGGNNKYASGGETGPGDEEAVIPLPDLKNEKARLAYAKAFKAKYGPDTPTGFGEIPLRAREKPVYGSDTSVNLINKAAKATGLDPALLYASSMIEGQSGLYAGAAGKSEKGELLYRGNTGDKDFPISGLWGFGLDSFTDYYPTLQKKGYLPKDFDKQFKVWEEEGGPLGADADPESVMFKNTDAGIQAKAAMMRAFYDEFDDYTKGKKITLTPEQRDYFALAHFNSGTHGYEMLDAYNKAGLLKGGKAIEAMPSIYVPFKSKGKVMSKEAAAKLHKQIYGNVMPRIKAARGLKKEKYFAAGGEVSAEEAAGAGGGGNGYAMAGQLLPQLGDALQMFLDKPSYTNQPIMNAQTARNMTRPTGYAYGGELDDIDDQDYNKWLKGMFQNQGAAEGEEDEGTEQEGEEGFDMQGQEGELGYEDEEGDEYADTENEDEEHGEKGDENAYAHGGIYIKPSKRGTFTAAANKHGKSVQTFAAQVMANKENYSPAMVKKANFARNAAKWKHAMGGGAAQVDQPVKYATGGWIKGAINPEHKGYCTPMTKSTCTPRRKALAMRFKKGGDLHKKAFGGFSASDVDGRREVGMYAFGSQAEVEHANNLLANTPNPKSLRYAYGGKNNAGGNASELQMLLYAHGGVFTDEDQREVELQRGVYATGGKAKKNWIQGAVNPAHKGYCTPMTKSTCTPRRKALAKTFKKHHGFHANGGEAQIEVEGNEILEAPNGEMVKAQGPSHEQGGIGMSVPEGTKIYSDRLGIEGKTMQQRKASRERILKRMEKAMDRNPTDQLLKNSYQRTSDVLGAEDAADMELMKVANKVYAAPTKTAPAEREWRQEGGKQEPNVTAAYGDVVQGDPWSAYINGLMGSQQDVKVPFQPGADTSQIPNRGRALSGSATGRGINVDAPINVRTAESIGLQTPSESSRYTIPEIPEDEPEYSSATGFTTGDYVGMAGNLFNAVAPIINTRNAARATKPERNRFKGFGREALEANQQAQSIAGKQQGYAKRGLDTAYNSAANRNRSGARDINTMRALDTIADINRNKAIGDIDLSYTNQMQGLLAQQGQLANTRDQVVMSGEQARDEREAQNIDNYYSNMAENLTNFGSNIQGLGKNLNTSQQNKDNTALLEQMSEYFDFGRDKKGKLVLRNKRKKS